MKTGALLVAMGLALAGLNGCKRSGPVEAVKVAGTPRATAPTTANALEEQRQAVLDQLDPIAPLGDGEPYVSPEGEHWTKYKSGLMAQYIKPELAGMVAQWGQRVSVAYTGINPRTNEIFDRKDEKNPLVFLVGQKNLVKGFNQAVSLMHAGEKCRFYLPADLAYGAEGAPRAGIGANEALIFEIQLLGITGEAVKPEDVIRKAEPAGPPAPGTESGK